MKTGKDKVCTQCHREFNTYAVMRSDQTEVCSYACWLLRKQAYELEYRRKQRGSLVLSVRPCNECGKPFECGKDLRVRFCENCRGARV